jgi:hypothetical protein
MALDMHALLVLVILIRIDTPSLDIVRLGQYGDRLPILIREVVRPTLARLMELMQLAVDLDPSVIVLVRDGCI